LANLGTDPDGFTFGEATDINGLGTAVGYYRKYDGAGTSLWYRATLWRADGSVLDLNTLIDPASGWTLREAWAISDTNWVAGYGIGSSAGCWSSRGAAYLRIPLGWSCENLSGILSGGGTNAVRARARIGSS
jgi:hypothetical protein